MTSETGWLEGPALQTYLALGGQFAPGDLVKIEPCRKKGHYYGTDSYFARRELVIRTWYDGSRTFDFRVESDRDSNGYPFCLCAVIAWKRKA